jgi:hypothetical protein
MFTSVVAKGGNAGCVRITRPGIPRREYPIEVTPISNRKINAVPGDTGTELMRLTAQESAAHPWAAQFGG